MTDAADPAVYALGHSDRELRRLGVQARLVDPITRRFFSEAGIGHGMRVLDVGSGVGDVAFLAAELVGDHGAVIGTDRSAAAIATARRRAAERSLETVSFRQGDPAEMSFEEPFDAVVGRYVLMFQPDPAAMLKRVVTHVRPGGLTVFHEPYRGGIRSYPKLGTYDRAWELINQTFRRLGADPEMGLKLHATFLAAGLPAPAMRLESIIAGGTTSLEHVHYEMDLAATLADEDEQLGTETAKELEPETLADRIFTEVQATQSVVLGRAEIGAWTRT
jgi:SAM-dependent methyltransferase